jgi:hypothetical protein
MKTALCVLLLSLCASAQVTFKKPITTYGGVGGENIAIGHFAGSNNFDILVKAEYESASGVCYPASAIVDKCLGNGTFSQPYVRSTVSTRRRAIS